MGVGEDGGALTGRRRTALPALAARTAPPPCSESLRRNELVSGLARLDGARRRKQFPEARRPGLIGALGNLVPDLHIVCGVLAPAGLDQIDQFLQPLLVPLDALGQVGDDDEAVVLEADGARVLLLRGARLVGAGAVAIVEGGIELVIEAVGLLVDLLDLRLQIGRASCRERV